MALWPKCLIIKLVFISEYCLLDLFSYSVGREERVPVFSWYTLVPCLRRPTVIHPLSSPHNPLSTVLTDLSGMSEHALDYRQSLTAQAYSGVPSNIVQYQNLNTSISSTGDILRNSSLSVSPQYPINYHNHKYSTANVTRETPSHCSVPPLCVTAEAKRVASANVEQMPAVIDPQTSRTDVTQSHIRPTKSASLSMPLPSGKMTSAVNSNCNCSCLTSSLCQASFTTVPGC